MKAAGLSDYFDAWPQPKVICVAKNYWGVDISGLEVFKSHPLNGSGCPDWHEDWSLDNPATGF
jgi:hypothetical protein